jgi:hypothetical protein
VSYNLILRGRASLENYFLYLDKYTSLSLNHLYIPIQKRSEL